MFWFFRGILIALSLLFIAVTIPILLYLIVVM